jgi:hypothetical protein
MTMENDPKGTTHDEPPTVEEDATSLLELVLEEARAHAADTPTVGRIDGVVIGRLHAFDGETALRVTFDGAPEGGVAARSMAALGAEDVGRDVALLFEGGDPARPVVMGRMHGSVPATRVIKADGERVELTADKEIVLSCGKASITLTKAGKILIRGEYVLSRSSGVHRIQGGSVQIN